MKPRSLYGMMTELVPVKNLYCKSNQVYIKNNKGFFYRIFFSKNLKKGFEGRKEERKAYISRKKFRFS